MEPVVRCPHCGAKNRLKAPPKGQKPACGKCGGDIPWLVDADDTTFSTELEASVPVLVDFWAPWCGPCRVVSPIVEDLAKEYAGKLKVVKVNVDENPVTAGRFQVRSIPTLMLFKGGLVLEQMVGAQPKGALKGRLERYLVA